MQRWVRAGPVMLQLNVSVEQIEGWTYSVQCTKCHLYEMDLPSSVWLPFEYDVPSKTAHVS